MADNLVKFNVTGAIRAVDNGNAATVELFNVDHRKALNGLALLIVKPQRGQAGRIREAARDGLDQGTAEITAQHGIIRTVLQYVPLW